MDAGKLRHRVTIQASALSAADAYGEQTQVWSDVVTVWAEVRTLDGNESWKIKQSQPEASVSVRIRYYADMTSEHRIKFGDRYLYPLSVVPDVLKREMRLVCREQL